MKKFSILFGFIFLFGLNSYCQVSDSLFELFCADEDIVILDEKMTVTFNGAKTYFSTVEVINECLLTIKTEEGLKEYSPIILPKGFDEVIIPHTTSIHQSPAVFNEIELITFRAHQFKNGQIGIPIEITKKFNTVRKIYGRGFHSGFNSFNDGYFSNASYYTFWFNDLEVGDTIKVAYQYKIKFSENKPKLSSNRIFFHAKYPRKSFQLTWSHYNNVQSNMLYVNNIEPNSRIVGQQIVHHWEMKNLPGALDEPGSRPYSELPCFIYVPSKMFEGTSITNLGGFDLWNSWPSMYYYMVHQRETELLKLAWDNFIGIKNKETNNFNKVHQRIQQKISSDTTGNIAMRNFQQFMVDDVEYSNAYNYYNQTENYKKRNPGADLWNLKIQDNLISEVYANMIYRFGLNFLTSYPMDIRSGITNQYYFPTVYDNNVLFVVIFEDQSLGFVLPKSEVNNYYFNELPFYFIDVPLYLNCISERLSKSNIEEVIYFYNHFFDSISVPSFGKCNIPSSKLKDNYRKTQSKVLVDLAGKSCTFNTKLYLSGQYSTLTRSVYMNRPNDSTINPRYLDPVWHVAEDVMLESIKAKPPLIYFPFTTSVGMKYHSKEFLHKENTHFSIDLGDFLKPVFYEENLPSVRFTDFYPDFKGSDSYSYMFEFKNPIKIISKPENIEIENDYAKLEFHLSQPGENKILLVCNFYTKAKKVDKEKYQLVVEFNNAIKNLFNSSIVFR